MTQPGPTQAGPTQPTPARPMPANPWAVTLGIVGLVALVFGVILLGTSFSTSSYLGAPAYDARNALAGEILLGVGVTFTVAWLAVGALRWQPPRRN